MMPRQKRGPPCTSQRPRRKNNMVLVMFFIVLWTNTEFSSNLLVVEAFLSPWENQKPHHYHHQQQQQQQQQQRCHHFQEHRPSSSIAFAKKTSRRKQNCVDKFPRLTRLSIAQTPNLGSSSISSSLGNSNNNSSSINHELAHEISSSNKATPPSEMDEYERDWHSLIGSYEAMDPAHWTTSSSVASSTNEGAPSLWTNADKRRIGITTAILAALLAAATRGAVRSGAWRYYLSGGVCAALSHTLPVPIDVVKTRKQVDPVYCDASMPAAFSKLVQTEGWSALWVGLGPTFWGYFFEGAVKFGVYEILKPALAVMITHTWLNFVTCAAVSGVAAGIMLCPVEALRIRLVAEPGYAAQGWLHGGVRMIQRDGFSGLTRGLTPMLYKQVPYTVAKNVSFDFLTKQMYHWTWATSMRGANVVIPLIAAAVASVLSCLSSQPGDMLLSLVNAHEGERRRTRDWMRQILHSDRGVRGLFVGVKTRLLHVGMIVTVQLLIYDFVKRLFGIAATGTV